MKANSSKYARIERERRFRFVGPMLPTEDVSVIVDRYIDGTRLRLRCVYGAPHGPVWKLAKIDSIEPGVKLITNLYLDEAEAILIETFPARIVKKTRHSVPHGAHQWAIDVYEDGDTIAEAEYEEGDNLLIPPWCGEEITRA